MNTRTAAIISARRLSLPLGLETSSLNYPVGDFLKKLTFSPVAPLEKEQSKAVLIPRIVLSGDHGACLSGDHSACKFSDVSPIYPRTSSPLENHSANRSSPFSHSPVPKDLPGRGRRSSCGPYFPKPPPLKETNVLDNGRKNWSLQICPNATTNFSFSRCAVGKSSDERKNTRDQSFDDVESLSSRSQSFSQVSSLSPCFEDSPKLEEATEKKDLYFSFKENATPEERSHEPVRKERMASSLTLGLPRIPLKKDRRASYCSLLTPGHSGTKERRASHHAILNVVETPKKTSISLSSIIGPGKFTSQEVHGSTGQEQLSSNQIVHFRRSFGLFPGRSSQNREPSPNLLSKYYPSLSALFVDGGVIGTGGFGVVKIGFWKGRKAAIKILIGTRAKSSVECERNVFKMDSHPSIVTTYALVTPYSPNMAEVFEKALEQNEVIHESKLPFLFGIPDKPSEDPNKSWAWIVTELCSSANLLKIINCNERLHENDLLRILMQITMALNHIHQHGMVHLDVKPSNCFVTLSGKIKLGDFGCLSKANEVPSRVLGTVAYQAPEVLKGNMVTDRCDIFSFAITAWQLLTTETPYQGFHPHVVIYKVIQMRHRPSAPNPPCCKSLFQDILLSIIKRCWAEEPKDRPSAAALTSILGSLSSSSAMF